MARLVPAWTVLCVVAALAAGCGSEPSDPTGDVVCEGCSDGLSVDLGRIAVGRLARARVSLVNRGDGPVVLRGATDAAALLPFESNLACADGCPVKTLGKGERWDLEASLTPTATGAIERPLVLTRDGGTLTLVLRAEGVDPRVRCSPGTLAFDPTSLTGAQTLSLTCTNEGSISVPIRVDAPTGEGAESFVPTVHPDEERLVSKGGTLEIPITFQPRAAGLQRAEVSIRTGSTRLATAALEGLGVDAPLAIEPPAACHDLGHVPPGEKRDLQLTLRNLLRQPVRIREVSSTGSAFAFRNQVPLDLEPEGEAAVEVRFEPAAAGPFESLLRFVTDVAGTQPEFCMKGVGGGPKLVCESTVLDFGDTTTSFPRELRLVCSNGGWVDPASDGDRLLLEGVEADAPFTVDVVGGIRPEGYEVGESFELSVTFSPLSGGAVSRTVRILANDAARPTTMIRVNGNGRVLPPCDFAFEPETLLFGNADGIPRTLDVVLRNTGADACIVAGPRLSGSSQFSLTGDIPANQELAPGRTVRFPVAFSPQPGPAAPTGIFSVELNTAEGRHEVQLFGSSQPSCLAAAPVDFGTAAEGCRSVKRQVALWSACPGVTVQSVAPVEPGGPFRIPSPPVLTAAPVLVEVEYLPSEIGAHHGGLAVQLSGAEPAAVVPLLGRTTEDGANVQRFGDRPVDVLLVLDNGGAAEDFGIHELADAFLEIPQELGLDFQVASTTTSLAPVVGNTCTGGVNGGENGRLFPVDSPTARLLRSIFPTPDQATTWRTITGVGSCATESRGLEASRRALSSPLIDHVDDPRTEDFADGNLGFLRTEADLEVVFLSDREDGSALPVEHYVDFLRSRKPAGKGRVRAHAIAPDASCAAGTPRYLGVANALGGSVDTICTSDPAWAMRQLSASAFAAGRCLPLDRAPADPDGDGPEAIESAIQVRRGSFEEPQRDFQGARWSYDPALQAVCFRSALQPEPGQIIEITYAGSCFAP